MKKLIYFADLTYDSNVLSSNVHPFGIGLLAAYLLDKLGDDIEIELFKYPQDLLSALERKTPDMIGFSNYSWTLYLSYEIAQKVKKTHPETVVIFGGPNYGFEREEAYEFWQRHPLMDFYIIKEGEQATERLISTLLDNEFDAERVKSLQLPLANCHYFVEGLGLVEGDVLPRMDISDIPSPYILGLMDKFFDSKLIPMIHTSRGCPFMCSFCAEGARYYTKVKHKMDLKSEIEYIAARTVGSPELYITDANFGMFKQDIEKARIIADIQEKTGYPQFIHVSTGKNHQERVLEVAKTVNGAMRGIAAALQSTDEKVLELVKRKNISQESLSEISKNATDNETTTYTEIILGLPGDSRKAHFQTIKDVVEAEMGIIRMYQALLLPQTEMNTPAYRAKFGMKTAFRLMPRSFGRYRLYGEEFVACELEELCIETDTLPFEDYIECRELNLTVEIIHNGNTFDEVKALCLQLGLSWFDFIVRFLDERKSNPKIAKLYADFVVGTSERIYDTRDELIDFVKTNYDELVSRTEGTNEMATGKATAYFSIFEDINKQVFTVFKAWLKDLSLLDAMTSLYIDELEQISLIRKNDILGDKKLALHSHFDWKKQVAANFKLAIDDVYFESGKEFAFIHEKEQREIIEQGVEKYGDTIDGLSRIIMFRVHHKQLFRSVKDVA